jgi:hypothetical protein
MNVHSQSDASAAAITNSYSGKIGKDQLLASRRAAVW